MQISRPISGIDLDIPNTRVLSSERRIIHRFRLNLYVHCPGFRDLELGYLKHYLG